jgi:hypothetical protein
MPARPKGHLGQDVAAFMAEVDDYCKRRGLKASSLGYYALKHSRFLERMNTRVGKTYQDMEAVRAYMRKNPAPAEGETGQPEAKGANDG